MLVGAGAWVPTITLFSHAHHTHTLSKITAQSPLFDWCVELIHCAPRQIFNIPRVSRCRLQHHEEKRMIGFHRETFCEARALVGATLLSAASQVGHRSSLCPSVSVLKSINIRATHARERTRECTLNSLTRAPKHAGTRENGRLTRSAPSTLDVPSSTWGLMVDLKPTPSLGVSRRPSFSWIVPSTGVLGVGQRQTSYRLTVFADVNSTGVGMISPHKHWAEPLTVWDSGWVHSDQQTFISCNQSLDYATMFSWTVSLVVVDDAGKNATLSSYGTLASFITELGNWNPSTKPIWAMLEPPPPPSPPPPRPPPGPPPFGRFVKGCYPFYSGMTCSSSRCGVPGAAGYPNGSMWYERFSDRTRYFVTNCNEHPSWCNANQTKCK